MKSLFVLYAAEKEYGFEKVFSEKSAFYLTLKYAKLICDENKNDDFKIAIFHTSVNKELILEEVESFNNEYKFNDKLFFVEKNVWTNEIFFKELSQIANEQNFKTIIYTNAFCPFINFDLTKNLLETHNDFECEYCFADGYPKGVSPEILDVGLCKILAELVKTKDEFKVLNVSDSSIFDLIKTDINSFEIETEISEIDWRMYRFDFICSKKENFVACKNLFNKIQSLKSSGEFLQSDDNNIQKILLVAAKTIDVLKPIPAFFNIQLCSKNLSDSPFSAFTKFKNQNPQNEIFTNDLSLENLKKILKQINEVNPESVISFSLWGNPLLYDNFIEAINEVFKYEEFSLFIETDGFDFDTQDLNYESELYKKLESLSERVQQIEQNSKTRKNGFSPLIFAVNIDAMSQETFEKIHPNQKLSNALLSYEILSKIFPQNVYAQFLRVEQNEEELESFYRKFNDVTKGKFIIQKYDDFCKELDDYKPADLSPVDRFPCWHLRRDFCILSNGDVPVCKSKSFESIEQNIFKNSILSISEKYNEELKKHIEENYCKGCKVCDEYYTYNF